MKQPGPHIEDKLLDFTYGELAAADAQDVEAHLKGCPACQGALEAIEGVRRVMARLPVESAPDNGLESLMGYAEQAARWVQAGPAPKSTWWRRWVIPAAGLSAAAIVAVVSMQVSKSSGQIDLASKSAPVAAPAPRQEMGETESAPLPANELQGLAGKRLTAAPEPPAPVAKAEPVPAMREPDSRPSPNDGDLFDIAPKGYKGAEKLAKRDDAPKAAHRRRAQDFKDEEEQQLAMRGGAGQDFAQKESADKPVPFQHLAKDEVAKDDQFASRSGDAAAKSAPAKVVEHGVGSFGLGGAGPGRQAPSEKPVAVASAAPPPPPAASAPAASRYQSATPAAPVADLSAEREEDEVEVARAAPEAKKKAGLKQEVDRVEVFTRQAREAERTGDYGRATAYLKEAVAAATGERRTDLLEEWCGIALKVDPSTETEPEPCAQLRPYRPGSASLQILARRKRAVLDMESPAQMDKAKASPPTAKPAAADKAANTQNGL
jgi:hypothetical protein